MNGYQRLADFRPESVLDPIADLVCGCDAHGARHEQVESMNIMRLGRARRMVRAGSVGERDIGVHWEDQLVASPVVPNDGVHLLRNGVDEGGLRRNVQTGKAGIDAAAPCTVSFTNRSADSSVTSSDRSAIRMRSKPALLRRLRNSPASDNEKETSTADIGTSRWRVVASNSAW